jgi:hypothetical protein
MVLGGKTLSLPLRHQEGVSKIYLIGYLDVDYGRDKLNRKSTTGNTFVLAGGVMSYNGIMRGAKSGLRFNDFRFWR